MRWALALLVGTSGCGLSTSDIYAEFEARSVGTQLKLSAYLYDGSPSSDFADLDDGDRVVATFRGRDEQLVGNRYGYSKLIDFDPAIAPDEIVEFELRRDSESSTTSAITAPPEPNVDPIPLFVSRNADLTITWSPPSDGDMSWKVESACLPDLYAMIPAGTTTVTISASSMKPSGPSTCTATLTLRRFRSTSADPMLAGGEVSFVWDKIFQFASTP